VAHASPEYRLQENTAFFSAFPMFVPSRSWQNDHSLYKMAKKAAFSYLHKPSIAPAETFPPFQN
jgi:hypothetical protein